MHYATWPCPKLLDRDIGGRYLASRGRTSSSRRRHVLLLASFRGVVRLQVRNDFLGGAFRDGCAVGFQHLVYFGGPDIRWQRWLHGDIARAVAGIAVGCYFTLAVAGR